MRFFTSQNHKWLPIAKILMRLPYTKAPLVAKKKIFSQIILNYSI